MSTPHSGERAVPQGKQRTRVDVAMRIARQPRSFHTSLSGVHARLPRVDGLGTELVGKPLPAAALGRHDAKNTAPGYAAANRADLTVGGRGE